MLADSLKGGIFLVEIMTVGRSDLGLFSLCMDVLLPRITANASIQCMKSAQVPVPAYPAPEVDVTPPSK